MLVSERKMDPVNNRERDCTSCRIISGGGLVGMSAYMSYHSVKAKGYGRLAMLGVAIGLGTLGLARILNLPPFKDAFSSQETTDRTKLLLSAI